MRTVEQSCALIDRIVGRCVREPEFGRRVLEDPDALLAEYALEEEELADFRALSRHAAEATVGWARLRAALLG